MNIRITRRIGLVAVVVAFAALPVAAGAGVRDGRSPDTNEAAALAHLDGRSPDTVDAALSAHETPPNVALRSPDTRDAALAAHSTPAPTIVVATSSAFDWTVAAIGAAGGFAIAILLAGGFVLLRSDRGKLAL